MLVLSLADCRVSLPWPDCFRLSRHQDRRSSSQHGDGMVGRRPGLAGQALGPVKTVCEECPGDKQAKDAAAPTSRRLARAGGARLDLSQGHFRTQKTKHSWIQLDLDL